MNSEKSLGNILLISPSLFSYHILIKNELENQGYLVDWVDDRGGVGFVKKSLLRFFPIYFTKFLDKKFSKIFENIKNDKYTSVLVVKGEGLSVNILNFLRSKFRSASFGLYLWDGVRNSSNSLNISHLFDAVSTFDFEDAKKNNWNYRPLFCKKISVDFLNEKKIKYDISFIGTLHSDRHYVVKNICDRYTFKYSMLFYLYVQNFILRLYKAIFDNSIIFSKKNIIKYKPIDFFNYNKIIGESKAILDIEHPAQNGFTMRTIETLMSGRKLITTNKNIINSNIYHPSRVLIINRDDPLISEDFMESEFLKIDDEIVDYYSVEYWVKELIFFQNRLDCFK